MKVARDNNTAEYSQVNRVTTININLDGEYPCDERKLDNFLQFVMLGLGIDKVYMEPPETDA